MDAIQSNLKVIEKPLSRQPGAGAVDSESGGAGVKFKVALLTGGSDRHYAFGLAMALVASGVAVDLIGGDQDDTPEMHSTANLTFLNLHGTVQGSVSRKLRQLASFYWRVIGYAAVSDARIFHILWNNKIELFDRTILTLYYKLLGKKIVLTAHNVNAGSRDRRDSTLNRLTLRMQYKLADHIFVHTGKMKDELIAQFWVEDRRVSVIPYGVNNAVPNTRLSCAEAKQRLGIGEDDRVILFFGAIKEYKGLEYLVQAFALLAAADSRYRLIIAGQRKKGYEKYWDDIEERILRDFAPKQVIQQIKFIPDDETELFFKAADVTVLPYTQIFQSGILFLAYSFGLPVIASDVGSFRQDIIEGATGFICRPNDSEDLSAVLEKYFHSDLYQHLEVRRHKIRDHVNRQNSWEGVAEITAQAYAQVDSLISHGQKQNKSA